MSDDDDTSSPSVTSPGGAHDLTGGGGGQRATLAVAVGREFGHVLEWDVDDETGEPVAGCYQCADNGWPCRPSLAAADAALALSASPTPAADAPAATGPERGRELADEQANRLTVLREVRARALASSAGAGEIGDGS